MSTNDDRIRYVLIKFKRYAGLRASDRECRKNLFVRRLMLIFRDVSAPIISNGYLPLLVYLLRW